MFKKWTTQWESCKKQLYSHYYILKCILILFLTSISILIENRYAPNRITKRISVSCEKQKTKKNPPSWNFLSEMTRKHVQSKQSTSFCVHNSPTLLISCLYCRNVLILRIMQIVRWHYCNSTMNHGNIARNFQLCLSLNRSLMRKTQNKRKIFNQKSFCIIPLIELIHWLQ